MTSIKKSAIIFCKTHLGGEVLWHLQQKIVHQEAEQIQKKVHPEALQRAQEKQHPKQGEERLREKVLILQ
jgi:hypothetical protein